MGSGQGRQRTGVASYFATGAFTDLNVTSPGTIVNYRGGEHIEGVDGARRRPLEKAADRTATR